MSINPHDLEKTSFFAYHCPVMKPDWNNLKRPIIGLSPMADMTDSPYCRVVKSLASPIIFREMVSADALVHGNAKTLKMLDVHDEERPLVQQIFGRDPEVMAQAAKIVVERQNPEFIDINMGCPARKLTSSFHGCALMKDHELATQIVKAVKAAVDIPVSVKTRLGWSDKTEILEFAQTLEKAGADLITIHGRTKKQGYAGQADWDMIRQTKERVSIPVLANGDITSPELAQKALDQTKADGILIARGALGNPWIFKQVEDYLAGRPVVEVSLAERTRVARLHAKLHVEHYGPKSLTTFRKHLANYFKGVPGVKKFRQQLVRVSTLEELDEILNQL